MCHVKVAVSMKDLGHTGGSMLGVMPMQSLHCALSSLSWKRRVWKKISTNHSMYIYNDGLDYLKGGSSVA